MVQIKNEKTGAVIATGEKSFVINPSFKLGNVFVSTNPNYLRVGNTADVKVDISLENQSNTEKTLRSVSTVFLGDELIETSEKTKVCNALDQFVQMDTFVFTPDVSSEKEYALKTDIYDGDEQISYAESVFKVVKASSDSQTYDFTMKSGDVQSQAIDVVVPQLPPRADVVFSFDLTGSMGGILGTAKSRAVEIMNQLNATGVDINYGVVSYMDYNGTYNSYGYYSTYGSGSDYPYKMNRSLTNSVASVSSAINSLRLGYGNDGPESYTRVLYESYADDTLAWRDGSKKLLVNYGDYIPHDNNINEGVPGLGGTSSTGGDPGRDNIMFTEDDLDLQTVVGNMADHNVQLIACQTYGSCNTYWNYWADITGGKAYDTNAREMASDVVDAIKTGLAAPEVNNLKLVPSMGFEAWISNIDPTSYSGPTDTVVPFTVELQVPQGTPGGDYHFTMDAIDDLGVKYGTYTFNIKVEAGEIVPLTTISTDKESYTVNEDVAVQVELENTKATTEQLTGIVEIIDSEGTQVSALADNIVVNLAAQETKNMNYTWNTGETVAGSYKAKVTWYKDGQNIASAVTGFKVISDKNMTAALRTDKQKYTADSDVSIVETVDNGSVNSIETSLNIKTDIKNSEGVILWSTENSVPEILPGGNQIIKNLWNTVKNAPGMYTVTMEVTKDGSVVFEDNAGFEIVAESPAQGITGISGSLKAEKEKIYPSEKANFQYTVSNTGNTAIENAQVRIRIIDAESEEVLDTLTNTVTLDVEGSSDGTLSWNHESLPVQNYMVVYDAVLADGREVPLDSGHITVEKPFEITADRLVEPRVLVWAESSANKAMAKNTLDDMAVYYTVVSNRDAFMDALRTDQYNVYVMLDTKLPLTGNEDQELAQEIAEGNGIIASLGANGDNLKNLGIFGADFKGFNPPKEFSVDCSSGTVFGNGMMTGQGKTQKLQLNGGTEEAVLNSKNGTSPGIVVNEYQDGTAVLFSFDLGACSGNIEDTLKKAIEITAPESETSGEYVEYQITVQGNAASEAVLELNLPEGAELTWSSPEQSDWTFSTEANQEEVFRVLIKQPENMEEPACIDAFYETFKGLFKFETVELN